jgi:putative FmdB family regulatory protein
MPTYSYKCRECGHLFDIVQGIDEEPKEQITHMNMDKGKVCQGSVYRIISGAAVHYKGNGWSGAGRDRQR